MKYLLIDTDVYIQCALLENEGDDKKAIETLLDLLERDQMKLLLPEVVDLEFNNVLRKKLSLLKREIGLIGKESIKKNSNFDDKVKQDMSDALDGVIAKREKNIDEVKKLLNKIFKHKNTVPLELTNESFLNAFKMYLAGEKPFTPDPIKGSIQADCLIIDVAKEYLKDKKDYELYICSRNKSDFSENPDNKEKKYTIAKDIENKFSNVEYTPNLFQLLNEKFGTKFGEKLLKKVTKEIQQEKDSTSPSFRVYPYQNMGTPSLISTPSIGTYGATGPTGPSIMSGNPAFLPRSNQNFVNNSGSISNTILCTECSKPIIVGPYSGNVCPHCGAYVSIS